ncbi:uncharacterized protein LOC116022450 [Ipomoea triloba]|uniref:uncharacterized protein LOC116022450 n=1 Tax=Ipomoea triloba TaxID=35885 RepID=UPI00125E8D42|nr:uncharacterized protein LOC116022450 [Ipomoea triloba]
MNPYFGGGMGMPQAQFPYFQGGMAQGYGQDQQQAPQQQGQGVGMQHLLNQMYPNFLQQFAQNFPQGVPPMFQQGVQPPMAAHLAPEFEEEDCILYPGVDANNFELKTSLIQMVQANQFGGARVEDPKAHVVHFDRICNTIKMNGIPTDAIKLRLFPFSLRDKALSWLNSFSANHFLTWEQLYKAFMQEYCPPSKAAKLKKLIQNFQQFGNENLHVAWKRFKDLRRQCPKNLLTPGDFISSFYEGLLDSSKIILDTSSYGGIFMDMGPDYAEQLIKRITSNTESWYNERSELPKKERPAGMFEVDDKMAMQAQLDSIQRMLKQMMQAPKQSVQAVNQPTLQGPSMPSSYSLPQSPCNSPGPQSIAIVACCAICGRNHASQSCQLLDPSGQGSFSNMEQVDAIGFSRPQGQGFQGYGQQRNQFGGQFGNQYGNSWNNQGRNPPPGFQGNQGNRGGNQAGFQGNQGNRGGNQGNNQGNQGNRGGNQGNNWRGQGNRGGNQGNNWRGNQGQGQWNNQGGQGYGNNQNHQGTSNSSQDPDMKTFMTMIMNQMSKLQTEVESMRTQQQSGGAQGSNQASSSSGKLPANTENPRNHVNAITTRSGKALKDPPYPTNDKELEKDNEKNESEQEKEEVEIQDILESDNEKEPIIQRDKAKGKTPMQVESNENKKGAPKDKQTHDSVIPCNLLPFPQRLWKSKDTERENKFKMMLDKLEISMPFVDAVTQIPSYKKFLKDILSNKKKLEKSAVVDMSEGALTCAVLQKHLPPKLKDPGSYAIPCIVGGFVVGRALCDLGASVSLMPYSLCKRLNLGEPKPTTMTLQMADRSIKRPVGVLEDIPVMIDQYFIPGDFVILDIEEDTKVPIILGRPFLATAGAIIDVKRGMLVMEVAEHKIEFDIFKMAKHQPSYVDE